jgi:uncharacterized protein (TIGR03437 family)
VAGATEAVTDAQGTTLAYADGSPYGALHVVTGPDWAAAQDLDLKLRGTAPALTGDGSALLFLDSDDLLQMYVRATGQVRSLGPEKFSTFAVGGDAVFAVTQQGDLVRIHLFSGERSVWLKPFIEVHSVEASTVTPNWCIWICYGATEYPRIVSPGMVVMLRGGFLDTPGWRVRTAGVEASLMPLSPNSAWLQIPNSADLNEGSAVEIFKPDFAIRYRFAIQVRSPALACLATVHEDFRGVVSESSPARPGEIVHVFLTGLQGEEPVANGAPNPADRIIAVANPPPLFDPASFEAVFFGLAPGLIGIQQLDIRVLKPSQGPLFAWPGVAFTYNLAFNCRPPAVATQ